MNKLKRLLILLLAIATVMVMAACTPTPCDVHVDSDDNSVCDVCGEYICAHDDFTDDEICDLCGADMEHKTCKDRNGDKKCDKCGKCTTHTDANADEVCDACNAELPHLTCKDTNDDGKCDRCAKCLTHKDANADEKCDNCEVALGHTKDEALDGVCDVCGEEIDVITIAEALEIASKLESKVETTERYYIKATIKSVTNSLYGALILTDDTGTISVYGTYSVDGALRYTELLEKPGKDDEVLLYCTLQNFDGSFEVRNARLISFVDYEVDLSKYESMDISTAREAEKGKLITLDGVVAKILYANGQIPAGFILVDEGASIYVYSGDVAGAVKEGNKITIAATKDYWILDKEISAAEKHGYKGCNQLTDAYLIENDNKTDNEFDKSWIENITVKELLETPVTENITTLLYKSIALIVKDVQPGFTNYYIYDLDGTTGTYVYTQCNGADFAWLDEFDGKICEIYYTALNAKSQNAYCSFRLQPVSVKTSDYTIADTDIPKFVYDYYIAGQFKTTYTGNPNLELIGLVANDILGFENVNINYISSGVVQLSVIDGKTYLVCNEIGTGTVEIIVTYGENRYTKTIEISVEEPTVAESITVSDAVAKENGTEVIIRGIVVGSTINQPGGIYLLDSTGLVAVKFVNADILAEFSIGDEIIVKGVRNVKTNGGTNFYGQTYIDGATLISNLYGDGEYPTDSFITDKTLGELYASDPLADLTTKLYVVSGTVSKKGSGFSVNYSLVNGSETLNLYSGGAAQYEWLDDYIGVDVTFEIALVNWNNKTYYRGCVLSVIVDGERVAVNDFNFPKA